MLFLFLDIRPLFSVTVSIHFVVLIVLTLSGCDRGRVNSIPEIAETGRPSSPPNVVVIVLDALRAGHLGAYGYHRDTSPFIDKLSRESLLFENALANSSYTGESVSALFTSKTPSANAYGAGWYARPAPGTNTLAKSMKQGGYRTGLFCDTPVLGPHFYEGFDEAVCLVPDFGSSGTGPMVVDHALEFIQQDNKTPFFVYLHLLDPHSPYAPPREFYLRFSDEVFPEPLRLFEDVRPNLPELVKNGFGPGAAPFEDMVLRYDAEIAFVDHCVQQFFNALEKLRLTDNLVIVITSDHGEEFLDNGFVEHAWRLYWESIHVPLLFWAPSRLQPESVTAAVSLVDVMPTLLTFANIPFDTGAVDGQTLVERGPQGRYLPKAPGKPIISELLLQTRPIIRSIIHNEFQYLAYWQWCEQAECSADAARQFAWREGLINDTITPTDIWGPVIREELIRNPERGGRVENRITEHSEMVAYFRNLLDTYQQSIPAQVDDAIKLETYEVGSSHGEPLSNEEIRQQMETLGYL